MKAQFWSFDVIFAIVIFSTAILLLTYVWYSINTQFSISYGSGVGNMETQLQTFDGRILSPGSPANWNYMVNVSNTVTWNNISAGLGTGGTQDAISNDKLATLISMSSTNYQASKEALGVGYDYYITIRGKGVYVTLGLNPSLYNATAIQVTNKPVLLNGEQAQMQVIIWTNTSFGVG